METCDVGPLVLSPICGGVSRYVTADWRYGENDMCPAYTNVGLSTCVVR
jgi:hypothetical protein